MQTVKEEKLDIEVLKVSSPILPQRAWQIESFLLKIFEYGDYSFRKALAGRLSSHLQCTFFIAQNNGCILAAAGSLYSMDNPAVAILGPVCVDPQHRRQGVAARACEFLLSHIKAQGTKAVYLGVRQDGPAVGLYRKLGFDNYRGIVMRRLFVSRHEFDKRYSPVQATIIRKMDWRDFAEIAALLCKSAKVHSFDFCRQVFSAKYTTIERFLPVFPDMMKSLEKNGGFANILATDQTQSIVGIAHINIQPSKLQNHIAVLDFFVLDGFIDKARELVSETLKQSGLNSNWIVICYCPNCDNQKKQILLSLGAKQYSTLPGFIKIHNKPEDVIILRL